MLEEFVPQFSALYERLKLENPVLIAKYKVASAPILESTAISTLKQYIFDVKEILLADKLKALREEEQATYTEVTKLLPLIQDLEKNPLFYQNIINQKASILDLCRSSIAQENSQLAVKLGMIVEGITLFERYNRSQSVLGILSFHRQFKECLAAYRISYAKCDILEHVILKLTETQLRSKASCKFQASSSPSRLVIEFGDITREDTQKIIAYMREKGDETACEGYGRRHYGSAMAESSVQLQCAMVSERRIVNFNSFDQTEEKVEPHSIEVDGNFFNTIIFPLVRDKIVNMTPEELSPYQVLSKDCFVAAPSNVSTLGIYGDGLRASLMSAEEPVAERVVHSNLA